MTNLPKLYPGHQHQWTDADPELFTNSLVRCTVCGFQAPRNVAGLDGPRYTEAEWQTALAQGRELARQLGIPLVRVDADGTIQQVPDNPIESEPA